MNTMSRPISRRKARKRRMRKIKLFSTIALMGLLIFIVTRTINATQWISVYDRMIYEQKGYPESLINLAEKNPETAQFVKDYENYEGNPDDIDISKEVEKGEIPLFLQWDERWGYEKYGSDFLAITGCGPTCLSMVYCGLTGKTDLNPYEMSKLASEGGFYVAGSGSSWSMMEDLAAQIGLTVHKVTFDAEHIMAALQEGHPIICIMGPGDFTTTGHFIVLTGVDRNGNIKINDPNSRKNSEKTWNLDDIMPQIRNIWSYS